MTEHKEGWSLDRTVPFGSIIMAISVIGSVMLWYGNTSASVESKLTEHSVQIQELQQNRQEMMAVLSKMDDKIDMLLKSSKGDRR